MNVLFHSNQLCLRGTEVAMYDYAYYNEAFLGHESIVIYNADSPNNQTAAIEKFNKRFRTIAYHEFSEVTKLAERLKADVIYQIKYGTNDGRNIQGVKNINHAVFPVNENEVHGDVYAYVSGWLSDFCSAGRIPFVPHMVDLQHMPGDFRKELCIPPETLVLGYYGGQDSFDIEFARQEVNNALRLRRDLIFLFMNVDRFVEDKNAIFLKGSASPIDKNKFINTCDAMIHARSIGETFGLAIAEFSARNKPIISYKECPQRAHIQLLGDKGMFYSDEHELRHILQNIDRNFIRERFWNAVGDQFSPSRVMKKFAAVFLD